MQTQSIKTHFWNDEAGNKIPVNRLVPSEKLRERLAVKIATNAEKLSKLLSEQKDLMRSSTEAVVKAIVEENEGKVKDTKGNITWYNFAGTIRIEVRISDRIEFDSVLISQVKSKLDELLDQNLSTTDTFVKDIVMQAFETSRGNLDTKKVLSLKKHAARIKHPLYLQAMELLDKSIRRPESKSYYLVSVKDGNGEFKSIDLNISSI